MAATPKGVARPAMSNTRASSVTGKMPASGQETVVAGSHHNTFLWPSAKLRDLERGVGSTHFHSTVRTNNASRVRFSATLGEEPVVEVGLV